MYVCCVCRLQTGRSNHALAVVRVGRLCVLGGESPPGILTYTSSVEEVNVRTRCSTEVGHLMYRECANLVCCSVEDKVLVCGARDDQANHYIQVWDMAMATTRHTIKLPYRGYSYVFGAVHAHGHLVLVARRYTCVCPMEDILQGQADRARLCDNFVSPTYMCSVVVSCDNQRLMLLGGESESKHYVYEAAINDVLHNIGGWRCVDTPWLLGDCGMIGGYDVAYINIPT